MLHYTLAEKIGEGGMGAVWRATDTTLSREVAIKFLPQAFAESPERLARFEREAKLLASLNHPNIAAIYGLHKEGEARFLAMELVEGEDLSKRLERGRLPLDEALDIGAQMAAGIEAAHEKGVVHRDLKPANVIVSPDGKVKLLDFGLAKALDNDPASGDPSHSPTMTSAGTVAGMILGTAAYMSPEQARGKPLDRRTDLWSFGCVLFECLTGKSLFAGETISDSLAAILRKEPDWSTLPDDTPPMVRLLLRRCLARDPNKRMRDAGDARLELEQAIENPSIEALGLMSTGSMSSVVAPPAAAAPRNWLPWVLLGIASLAAVFFALRPGGSVGSESAPRRLTLPVSSVVEFGDGGNLPPPAVSPDGNSVVFGQLGDDGVSRLWLRPLDSFESRELPGTENAKIAFWSPDSRHIGFYLDGQLKRMELASGRVQSIGGESLELSRPRGASWGPNGQILFTPNSNTGVWIVDAAGGTPRQITTPDPDIVDCSHRWPHFLPDGEHFLFLLWTNDFKALEQFGGVYVGSVSGDTEPVRLVSDASSMAYAPPGYLLVMQDSNLIAVPFDAGKREVHGEATIVASEVLFSANSGHAAFSVSTEGSLVYARGSAALPPADFVWYDRGGNETPTLLKPTPFLDNLRVSEDGSRAVALMPDTTGDGAVWVLDLIRGVPSRLTPPTPFSYANPVLSADADRVLYVSPESGTYDFYLRNADGSGAEQPVLQSNADKALFDWSRDGQRVLYGQSEIMTIGADLILYDVQTEQSEVIVAGDRVLLEGRFSPDGRHIAYVATDSGRTEVFVQTIDGGARGQVSTSGGVNPHWRSDGGEILYLDSDRRMMAVSVDFGAGGWTLGTPEALFTLDPKAVAIDATGDHRRFLGVTVDRVASDPLHVILNWNADL
ncbi:serine/threonine-protein kinase [bacterium]|nr:serine/threonine-protein kinase [bacterium]